MEETDAALVERTRRGDQDAFRVLVERHSRGVFRLAFRMMGNETDAEDVVQEAFLRAYRQLDRFETRSAFGTWIYRIATNYAIDELRARKRVDDPSEVEHPSRDPLPDRLAWAGEVRVRFHQALKELSPQERTAFSLRHLDGMSIDQISQVLGVRENATKNSIFRAVQKLRRALEPLAGAAV